MIILFLFIDNIVITINIINNNNINIVYNKNFSIITTSSINLVII